MKFRSGDASSTQNATRRATSVSVRIPMIFPDSALANRADDLESAILATASPQLVSSVTTGGGGLIASPTVFEKMVANDCME